MPADRFEAARLQKLEKLAELGIDPFGQRFDGHMPIAEARDRCPAEGGVDGERVRVAGRIIRWPKTGKLQFLHIQDASGRIQLMVSQRDVGEPVWQMLENLDLGDLVGVDGLLRRTRTGEISIFVDGLTILGKSLAQPPEKFHGVHDVELLLRRRYIDMIYNEGVLDRLLLRSEIFDSIRQTLRARRFVEVETPVLHAVAGGAAARPFITHHNALDINLYLRIALELHLKRLMVGGIERVYEIGRVFRNEGIDATHNPEFTMIEIYQAYGNYETMMDLTEAIIGDAARVVAARLRSRPPAAGTDAATGDAAGESSTAVSPALPELALPWGDGHIDFTPPWPRRTYADLFREYAGCDMGDAAAVQARAREQAAHGAIKADFIQRMEAGSVHPDVVVSEVFEACVEHHLVGPVFVIDYPASICPLTKRKAGAPHIAERFELFINGMELANAYTELNDPYLQEELFRTQLAGQAAEDSMATMDHEFIDALKVGMPAAGGLGIGIDRLVMLLTNTRSIRDVIFFPLLRPET